MQNRMARMHPQQQEIFKKKQKRMTCPRNKAGLTKFTVVCNQCNDVVGELYAKDASLSDNDWCDLHYICKAVRGKHVTLWHGAMSVNLNPDTGQVGFECACGNDSRGADDEGKAFGRETSKFKLVEAT